MINLSDGKKLSELGSHQLFCASKILEIPDEYKSPMQSVLTKYFQTIGPTEEKMHQLAPEDAFTPFNTDILFNIIKEEVKDDHLSHD